MIIDKQCVYISYPIKIGNPALLGLYESNRQLTMDTTFLNNKDYYVAMGPYLLEAEFGFYKLWGEKTGRNLSGTFSGKFNGVYPKITMQIRKLNRSEVEFISDVLDTALEKTMYYDPKKKMWRIMETYSNDFVYKNKTIITENKKAEGFSWAVISTAKRS